MHDTPARILIVDDDSRNRGLLEVMLAPEGFDVAAAGSGEDALASVAQQRPDLILLDVLMPGLDGYQVTTRIKADPATQNIPVILITALEDHDARLRGLRAGAEEFLTKPVDRAELRARVRNLLRLKAYGDYHDKYSHLLEGEVSARTADLRYERDRAQRYLDRATVILVALDGNGRITLANRFACTVLGWTEEELVGRDWFDTCLVPRTRDHVRERFATLLRGDVSIVENTILTRSGEERVIEWHNTVLRDGAGHVTGTFSSGTDVTERNQAVDALRTAEERTWFALANAKVGIWEMEYPAGLVRWSEVVELQYGLRPGTFAGTFDAFVDRIHPDDRESVLQTYADATKSGAEFSIQHRSIHPDGTVRWLSGTGRFDLDRDGNPVRGIGISQDITEQRTLEAQVRQATKMEAVGQLASGVAHDFNNLLTVILGFAEYVAADEQMGDSYGHELAEIIGAARRAAGLTKQLLAFGRQQVLRAAPLDMNGLMTDMTAMLTRLIAVDIEVSLALAPDLCPALADRGQVEQVVMNLVVNACDAMPEGGRLTIGTSLVDLENSAFHAEAITQGQYVCLTIADTGSGMTHETQQHLFEPFFTTKAVGKGTGLGLSTTYGIVKQSKGHVTVYSELGQGTTFKVYLPCSRARVPVEVSVVAAAAPASAPSQTVLLVEDEPSVRQLSKRILNDAGYRVVEAANGDDAERLFAQEHDAIDLLVTDMIMPGCNGPELFRRLHARAPGLRVLFMSGFTEQAALNLVGTDDGLRFVQKPFTAAELARQVRDALTH